MDEVYDGGDILVIRNRGQEYRVALADVINVSASTAVNPPRITLKLRGLSATCGLGTEFCSSPTRVFTLNPFAKNAVAEDLIVRADQARSAPPG